MLDPKLLATISRILRSQGSAELARGMRPAEAIARVWDRHARKTPWLSDYPELRAQLRRHVLAEARQDTSGDDEITSVFASYRTSAPLSAHRNARAPAESR